MTTVVARVATCPLHFYISNTPPPPPPSLSPACSTSSKQATEAVDILMFQEREIAMREKAVIVKSSNLIEEQSRGAKIV